MPNNTPGQTVTSCKEKIVYSRGGSKCNSKGKYCIPSTSNKKNCEDWCVLDKPKSDKTIKKKPAKKDYDVQSVSSSSASSDGTFECIELSEGEEAFIVDGHSLIGQDANAADCIPHST